MLHLFMYLHIYIIYVLIKVLRFHETHFLDSSPTCLDHLCDYIGVSGLPPSNRWVLWFLS